MTVVLLNIQRIFLTLSLFSFTLSVSAQVVEVCVGEDAAVCTGQTVQIQDCQGSSQNPLGLTLNSPTVIPQLSDDQWSGIHPIGFTFNFYGNDVTQFRIGSNGVITFNIAQAGFNPWALGGVGQLPTAGFPSAHNAVMPCYADINPSAPGNVGNIQYQTLGTAPNRQLVILFREIGAFSCNQNVCHYFATILYETSNVVEFHVGSKPICGTWNGGLAIQGIQAPGGTAATTTPGRNNAQWTAYNDGRRFTPVSPTNTSSYTHSEIPYIHVSGVGSGIVWANTANNNTSPYNNGVLNVTNISTTPVGYFVSGTSCGLPIGALSDTTWVSISEITGTMSSTSDFCSGGVGTATISNVGGSNPPFTYLWSPSGSTTNTAANLEAGTHTVTVSDSGGCDVDFDIVVTNDQPAATATATLESCVGSSNATATAEMIPPVGTLTYLWDDPLGQTTQTATGLTAGTYTCVITSSQNCTVTASVTVEVDNPMVATFSSIVDANCNSSNTGGATVTVIDGNEPFTYSWSGSNQTGNSVNDLFAGEHTVTITDAVGCVDNLAFTINEPPALSITSISPEQQVCPGDDAQLNATASGGSTPYIYTWFNNGVQVAQGQSVTVTPSSALTEYCVVLTEQCGSPADTACTVVTWPAHISPTFSSDTTRGCNPTEITFENTTDSEIIANVFFEFGDGSSVNVGPNQNFSNIYTYSGSFNVNMTVTTINGCVYDTTLVNYIQIGDFPNANFSWFPSEIPMFNPVANFMDASSSDVIFWNWQFQSGAPAASSSQNPSTTFPAGEVGEYLVTLIVTNNFGCADTIQQYVPVISDVIIYAPNTFTPDNDQFNQGWKVYMQGIDIYQFNLIIFNRWGEVVWESNNIDAAWEGTYGSKMAPEGTYIWRIRTKNPYDDNVYEFNGHVHLIR